jgi:beta-glucosidase
MTLEEKVRQLDFYDGDESLQPGLPKKGNRTPPGADVFSETRAEHLFGTLGAGAVHDVEPSAGLYNRMQRWLIGHNRLRIPALFIEEGLHGYSNGTVFPAPINLGATFDPGLAHDTAASIAAEMRSTGAAMVLAPVLDLARDPRWGRVEENFGEDTFLTTRMGVSYVRGAQGDSLATDHTIVAEPKHFAGHGSPEGGSNTSPVHMGERELRSTMLPPFEAAFREGQAMATMAAYHDIDGIPITADSELLTTILRGEWGFRGFVLSDLGAIKRLETAHHVAGSPSDAVCMAVHAGVDMQFYDYPHNVFEHALIDCLHDGRLKQSDLDRAVSAVLRVKFQLGLFEKPYVDEALAVKEHRSTEHLAVSLRSARESITLLKNANAVLPLSKSVRRIAVLGPNGAVARYGDYEEEKNGLRISIVDGIRKLVPEATVSVDEGVDIQKALAAARDAEVILLALGEKQGISGEGFDRTNLDLPGNQQELLEAAVGTGKPVVLVLENGRPLTIGWAAEHVPAIVEAWYPGEYGGQAIAETLFGDINPAGRLPVSFPRTIGQLPDFYSALSSRQHRYVDSDGKPLFPFGFGLSYTTFEYSAFTISAQPGSQDVLAKVTVRNTGTRSGDEIVQFYVRQEVSSVATPGRALKGFQRIHLDPNESREVELRVPQRVLAIWNRQHQWVTERGQYTAWIGGSSTATLSAKFQLR